MNYEDILKLNVFETPQAAKEAVFLSYLNELTNHHKKNSNAYHSILTAFGLKGEFGSMSDVPFLPVSLFKELDLKSVSDEDVFKTMTSSGTTGQAVSKIFLDRTTASNQQKTLAKIVGSFLGANRLPMIIIDSPGVLKDRAMFSARGAGILGFSIFGSKSFYALKDDMSLDIDGLKSFVEQYNSKRVLIFGFTFMIWQHFIKELEKLELILDLPQAIVFHGGGWKKLHEERVANQDFKTRLRNVTNIQEVHDYYGMVEQTGTIYVECEHGHLHCSAYSDIIIRDYDRFTELPIKHTGIIQVLSLLPESYPGHSLLTEDQGTIWGIDDCPCGRMGKHFTIEGRLQHAEIRGCSDTYASDFK
jgi:phenylacetate-coenzyme A ligase PaaK-like adenylate-forming protein